MLTTEWTNDKMMDFLEHYQSEPILWDPKHQGHKDKKNVNDRWLRISELL